MWFVAQTTSQPIHFLLLFSFSLQTKLSHMFPFSEIFRQVSVQRVAISGTFYGARRMCRHEASVCRTGRQDWRLTCRGPGEPEGQQQQQAREPRLERHGRPFLQTRVSSSGRVAAAVCFSETRSGTGSGGEAVCQVTCSDTLCLTHSPTQEEIAKAQKHTLNASCFPPPGAQTSP